MKKIKKPIRHLIAAAVVAVTAGVALAACGTQTHEEIKNINGQQFLCTWTENYDAPFTKKDYRCEAFQNGVQP